LRFEDVFFRGPEMRGQLGNGRRVPELDVQLLDRAIDGEVEFL